MVKNKYKNTILTYVKIKNSEQGGASFVVFDLLICLIFSSHVVLFASCD